MMAEDILMKNSKTQSTMKRKILVLDDQGSFPEDLMEYAVHLAERLRHDLLVLSADTAWEGERFRKRAGDMAKAFRTKAEANGIGCESMVRKGDLGTVIQEIKEKEKRIGFILTDAGIDRRIIAEHIPLPIFSMESKHHRNGGMLMTKRATGQKKKLAMKTAGFGMITAILYAAVFMNADMVMNYFTRGGWYAALPVASVFIFSFAHGAFAGNLWSLLGIEAVQKDALREVERKVIQKKQKIAKKPRAYSYVNPFHRI
ncbi:MAG: hypothetical protein ABIK15_07950 [Pseudomonadota bacterium]